MVRYNIPTSSQTLKKIAVNTNALGYTTVNNGLPIYTHTT